MYNSKDTQYSRPDSDSDRNNSNESEGGSEGEGSNKSEHGVPDWGESERLQRLNQIITDVSEMNFHWEEMFSLR